MKVKIKLMVNGDICLLEVPSSRTLLEVLRDDLNLTGTKKGCGEGECGACTVLMDGKPVNSCLLLALQADGKDIITVEGLAGEKLHPVQKAFVSRGAIQCGYCSPGFIMTTIALLKKSPNPSDDEIKTAIAGNICRCTGYKKIIDAIKEAAVRLQGGGENV